MRPKQIIVVDDGSEDETCAIVHKYKALRVGATLRAPDGRTLGFLRRKANKRPLLASDDATVLADDGPAAARSDAVHEFFAVPARAEGLAQIGRYVVLDKLDASGRQLKQKVMDAGDSGIYLRGSSKSQVNIWCWPCGSGEVYGYRTEMEMLIAAVIGYLRVRKQQKEAEALEEGILAQGAASAANAPDPRSFWQRLRAGFAALPVDALHANSIERLPRDVAGLGQRGDWLLSLRNLDRVVVLGARDGRLLASLGEGTLERQHHASLLPNDDVLVFDNGRGRDSRVLALDPRRGTVDWRYAGTSDRGLRSRSQGAAERLANGNTLVVESDRGRAIEVTPEGAIVWEFLHPQDDAHRGTRASIYRMTRLPLRAFTP